MYTSLAAGVEQKILHNQFCAAVTGNLMAYRDSSYLAQNQVKMKVEHKTSYVEYLTRSILGTQLTRGWLGSELDSCNDVHNTPEQLTTFYSDIRKAVRGGENLREIGRFTSIGSL